MDASASSSTGSTTSKSGHPPLPASLRKAAPGRAADDAPLSLRVWTVPQRVELLRGEAVVWQAPVSTSALGLGTAEGSGRTPLGRFHIAEKIGEGEPLGARFVGRKATGEVWPQQDDPAADWILTRILWLAGDEAANSNTQGRYIYFHGTNREDQIGTPSSRGCIRLRNAEMLELFGRVEVGTPVEILG